MITKSKTCRLCHALKPLNTEYYTIKKSNRDGFNNTCKDCINKKVKSMRLNKTDKENIVRRACSKLEKRVVEARKAFHKAAEPCVLKHIGTPSERKQMSELPSGWLIINNAWSLDLPSHTYEDYTGDRRRETPRLDVPHPIPAKLQYKNSRIQPSEKAKEAWFDLIDALNAFHKVSDELYGRLKYVGTLSKLHEAWPESVELTKGMSAPKTKALMVRFDDIQEKLK